MRLAVGEEPGEPIGGFGKKRWTEVVDIVDGGGLAGARDDEGARLPNGAVEIGIGGNRDC